MGAILAAQVEGAVDFMSKRMSRNMPGGRPSWAPRRAARNDDSGSLGAVRLPRPVRIDHDARSESIRGVGRLERLGIILEDFHHRLLLQLQAAKSPKTPLWGPTLGLGAVETAEMARPPVAPFRWRTHIYFQSQAFAVGRSHALTAGGVFDKVPYIVPR